MMRSTELWEMSRSCQSATFSNAAWALARTTRARPQICSQPTGLRLCGMAELPRCPLAKGSSASRTSVRCRWRISSAIFSSVAAMIASVATYCAWRSRWITCEATGVAARPRRRQMASSTSRAQMRGVAHRAGNFADGHLPAPLRRKRSMLRRFSVVPVGDLEAKGDGLGMHAVGAADLRRVLKFARARSEHFAEAHQALLDDSRGVAQLQRLRGVHHVIRGQAVVQPARRVRDRQWFRRRPA